MAQWRFAGDGAVEVHRWRASAHRYWNNRPGLGAPGEEAFGDAEPAVDPGGMLAEPAGPF
jgi:hypothetical protein